MKSRIILRANRDEILAIGQLVFKMDRSTIDRSIVSALNEGTLEIAGDRYDLRELCPTHGSPLPCERCEAKVRFRKEQNRKVNG